MDQGEQTETETEARPPAQGSKHLVVTPSPHCMHSFITLPVLTEEEVIGPARPQQADAPPAAQQFQQLLLTHEQIADLIITLHRDLHTRVPGGFQAELLCDILEGSKGGPRGSTNGGDGDPPQSPN
jgi:hypothetical protein